MSSQVTFILKFFLNKNLVLSRTRAWEQTVASRGKGPDFWGSYVEGKPPLSPLLHYILSKAGVLALRMEGSAEC